jgi:tetratricopeptide (TPR) repeat protein
MEALERKLDQLLKDDSNPNLYNEIGVLLYQMKDWKNAQLYFQRACELNPKNKDFLYNNASVLFEQCDWRKALSIYQNYFELQPDDKEVLQKVRDIYYLLGEYEQGAKIN